MVVRIATPADSAAWDAFVQQHPQGSPFHLQAWRKTIEDSFAFTPLYLLAEDEGRICGILPLFLVSNVLIKKALISSPFAVYGGILAASPSAANALHSEAKARGTQLGVQYVELRNGYSEQCVGEPNVDRYVTFLSEIGPDEEKILESIPRKVRYMVRKSLKHGFVSRVTRELPAFEHLYADSLRRLGTPSFPHRFFQSILTNFGTSVEIREYDLNGKTVSAVLSFHFGDRILPYYGAADSAFNAFAPNNYMYFELMRWAGQNGYKTFDFGRSKLGSGSYEFKAHWGMREEVLPYQIILIKRKDLPNFSPTNPKYKLAIKMWQKLPLSVTRAIGPSLLKLVP
jgi:FemAB-related protein (PEP-CTERM system-associated)